MIKQNCNMWNKTKYLSFALHKSNYVDTTEMPGALKHAEKT